jgi:hypothetical protein
MCAMSVRAANRHAILLGKDAAFPAPIAYYLAHEIGHIALGHLAEATAVVDFHDPLQQRENIDDEERAADSYALELLTGKPELVVSTEARRFTARELARNLLETASSVQVEPGTLALCFGYSTQEWAKAQAAMKQIYSAEKAVWSEVNQIAMRELNWDALSEDFALFVRAVMGGLPDVVRRH